MQRQFLRFHLRGSVYFDREDVATPSPWNIAVRKSFKAATAASSSPSLENWVGFNKSMDTGWISRQQSCRIDYLQLPFKILTNNFIFLLKVIQFIPASTLSASGRTLISLCNCLILPIETDNGRFRIRTIAAKSKTL